MLSLQERPKMQCEIKDAVHNKMRCWYAKAAILCPFRLVLVWFDNFALPKFSNIATWYWILSLNEFYYITIYSMSNLRKLEIILYSS